MSIYYTPEQKKTVPLNGTVFNINQKLTAGRNVP